MGFLVSRGLGRASARLTAEMRGRDGYAIYSYRSSIHNGSARIR